MNHARSPFPRRIEDDKRLVWGQTADGTYLQVIYVLDPDDVVFVIHTMPMTDRQKRKLRRGGNEQAFDENVVLEDEARGS